MSQTAYEDAVRLFDHALAAEAGHASPAGTRGELLISKATAQYLAYDIADAVRTCEEAAALARHIGDAAGLGQAALVLAELADPAWLAKIKPGCEKAIAGLPAHDSVLLARLLAQQVVVESARGEAEQAAHASGVALAMAEHLDDPGALIAALRARQHAYAAPEGNDERLALGDRMLAIAGRAGDSTALWGHLWRFDALVQTGRVDDAEIQLDLLEPVVARLRQPLARWHLLRSRAAIHQGRRHFTAAHDTLDLAARIAELGDHANARAGIEFTRVFIDTMTAETVSPTAVDTVKTTVPVPLVRLLGRFLLRHRGHGGRADQGLGALLPGHHRGGVRTHRHRDRSPSRRSSRQRRGRSGALRGPVTASRRRTPPPTRTIHGPARGARTGTHGTGHR